MTDRYTKNLMALEARFPTAATAVRGAGDDVEILPSRKGVPTGKLSGSYLHSAYDPMDEAIKFTRGHGLGPGDHVALYGMGLGHHLKPLLDIIGPQGLLVVAEANAAILKAALAVVDDPAVLNDPRLTVVAGSGEAEFLSQWAKALAALDTERTRVVIFSPSLRNMPAGFNMARRAVEMVRMERRFPVIMGEVENENFRRNLPRIKKSAGVSALRGTLTGRGAFVVGAGPTLDRDIVELCRNSPMAIFSSDTACPVLLSAGITPHMVFTADPQPVSRWHFDLAGRYDIPLVLPPTACANLVGSWSGPLYFGFPAPERHKDPARSWMRSMGVFEGGGSVSAYALETAFMAGASHVVLAGQDFGYPWGRVYATGCLPDWSQVSMSQEGLARERNYFNNGTTLTALALYSYRRAFEDLIRAHDGTRVYTLSAHGVALEGVEAIPSPAVLGIKPGEGFEFNAPAFSGNGYTAEVERAFMDWLEGQ
ncbi:MAG: motility associated factor glycosyltransferase family protein [Nitrospinae bacterium]|nr:motility associated factor glycosyltransferase family protein [Nitrospinota bacterium]